MILIYIIKLVWWESWSIWTEAKPQTNPSSQPFELPDFCQLGLGSTWFYLQIISCRWYNLACKIFILTNFVMICRLCFNACCKFARLCLLLRLAESVVGSVGSQEDPSVTQQVTLLCSFSLFCARVHWKLLQMHFSRLNHCKHWLAAIFCVSQ